MSTNHKIFFYKKHHTTCVASIINRYNHVKRDKNNIGGPLRFSLKKHPNRIEENRKLEKGSNSPLY